MRNESVKTMTMCAIMAALMCILGPMSIPIGAVPISFTNLVIYLTVYLLRIPYEEQCSLRSLNPE